jgi:DNA-binding beta-propeller fold protein YncE
MDCRRIQSFVLSGLAVCATAAAQEAPIPAATELSGQPFAIKDKWVIGGVGKWDYLSLDPVARQLFIAHEDTVQVVDIASGQVSGRIAGFGEARSIVLDPAGQFGYVSDSREQDIKVFDRRSLKIETTISLDCSPRSMTIPPVQDILIAICGSAVPAPPVDPHSRPRPTSTRQPRVVPTQPAKGDSWIAVIDTDARAVLVYLLVGGDFRIAQPDRDGSVYVTVGPAKRDTDKLLGTFSPYESKVWQQSVARIDVQALVEDGRQSLAKRAESAKPGDYPAPHWDTDDASRSGYVTYFPLDSTCPNPQGLAVDSHTARLFVACDNQVLLVMDSNRGQVLKSLTTGPGTDAVVYDENRGFIFTANGGGYGSITIAQQHVSDSYSIVQSLPTMQQARTMAIDSSTGLVYLVTTLYGANLADPPVNGIGKLELNPVNGSFQVLVIGN